MDPAPGSRRLDRWRARASALAAPAAELLEAFAEIGLEPAIGRLVETLALELLGEQRLVGDAPRLVVRVDVALAAAEPACAGVVGVAEGIGRQHRAVLVDLRAGGGDPPVRSVRLRRQRQVG